MFCDVRVPFSVVRWAGLVNGDVCVVPRKGACRVLRILVHLYSLLHILLCLCVGSLQKERGSSVSGFLFHSAFMECLLGTCSKYSVLWFRGSWGLGSPLIVWDPG